MGAWKELKAALGMSAEAACATVLDSGLRGRGGAAFPAGINGAPFAKRKPRKSTSSAMRMKAIPARSPIGSRWKAIRFV